MGARRDGRPDSASVETFSGVLSPEELLDLTSRVNPFCHGEWDGEKRSLDGADTGDFGNFDVVEVVRSAVSNDDEWDGEVAAILLLKDGRFIVYETFWGPTGNGFNRDAYGGDATLGFANSLEAAIRYGLSDDGRAMMGLTLADAVARFMSPASATVFLEIGFRSAKTP